jgi:RNA polymerase sigma factor (sigma-70 family)
MSEHHEPGPSLQGGIDELVKSASEGDRAALEAVIRAVSNDLYRLALRMTGNIADAEDATQEILIKLITRFGSYRGEASVKTWSYRIAMNHLLDRRKGRMEVLDLNYDSFGADLVDGLSDAALGDDAALAHEVKLGCTLAMLMCLDRGERAAYVLREVFDLPNDAAAEILGIEPAAFRQRLSRARRGVEGFTHSFCGLVNADAPCHCSRRVSRAVELGRITRDNLALFGHPRSTSEEYVQEMEHLHTAASLMRSHPEYAAPEPIIQTILRSLLFTRPDSS